MLPIEDVQVKGIQYKGELLGLRFTIKDGRMFDIGREEIRGLGFRQFRISERVELFEEGDLLVTKEEQDTGVLAEDISENPEGLQWVRVLLNKPEIIKKLGGFQLPYEVSLGAFLNDEDWIPVKEERTDEYKGQHSIIMPNGKMFPQGWIGKAKSLDQAKRNFHREQTKLALHRGEDVALAAVESYKDLLKSREYILEVEKRFTFKGNLGTYKHEGYSVQFSLDKYPKPRYEQRAFVKKYGLVAQGINKELTESWFDALEITCIALTRLVDR